MVSRFAVATRGCGETETADVRELPSTVPATLISTLRHSPGTS